jgi:hypothetical protein
MPITATWDNEAQTAVRIDSTGVSTWDEHFAAVEQMRALVSSVKHQVDLIAYIHADAELPQGNFLPHLTKAARKAPHNLGVTVNVGLSPFLKTVTDITSKIFPAVSKHGTYTANSLEEARAIIAEKRGK